MTGLRYFQNAPAPYVPGVFRGTWSDTSNCVTIGLGSRRGTKTSVSDSETSTSGTWSMCLLRVVIAVDRAVSLLSSDPQQPLEMRVGRLNTVASAFVMKDHVWVTTGATDTVRATLDNNNVSTAVWTQTTPTFSGRGLPPLNTSLSAGDFIVIEVGADANQTTSTSRTAEMYYGGHLPASMPLDGAPTDNPDTASGWVEFCDALDAVITPLQDGSFLPFCRA